MSDRLRHEPDQPFNTSQSTGRGGLSRRHLLSAGAAGAISFAATSCSDETSVPDSSPPPEDGDASSNDTPGADLTLAVTAMNMETLAVTTYDTAMQAMDEARLGEVPPAINTLVTTVRAHHVAHREAWTELIGNADTGPPSPVLDVMGRNFAQEAAELSDPLGLARLTLLVEQGIADTYFLVIPSLTAEPVLRLASTIQAVDSQHAAIARFLLGQYPVPDTFSSGDRAFGQSSE